VTFVAEFVHKSKSELVELFYQKRGQTKLHIKIIDCALINEAEEKRFFELFGELCDTIAIEHLTPTLKEIDYQNLAHGKPLDLTQSGNCLIASEICPQPFYMIQINPDGAVVPCCSMSYPGVFGNAAQQDISSIWNGEKLSKFRRLLLDGVKQAGSVCAGCSLYKYGLFPEDILEPYVQHLKVLY
jgi:radical SAM protein with 4Fe4S-binding SPASM domain